MSDVMIYVGSEDSLGFPINTEDWCKSGSSGSTETKEYSHNLPIKKTWR